MREDLSIDMETGNQSRRIWTQEEEERADLMSRQWLEAQKAREEDLEIVRRRAAQDPTFAALLRLIGVREV